MGARTRRRLVVAAFVVALTIPAETILLNALQTPDPHSAVRTWVATLSFDDLRGASTRVSEYPFAYRREIMRALPPVLRAFVWQKHIRTYLYSHDDLDPGAVALLNAMITEITPEALSRPSADTVARVNALGHRDQGGARCRPGGVPAVPARTEGRNVREHRAAQSAARERRAPHVHRLAEGPTDCDCNIDWGGCGFGATCKDGTGCNPDDDWPMCGWLWNSTCDGKCSMGSPHD